MSSWFAPTLTFRGRNGTGEQRRSCWAGGGALLRGACTSPLGWGHLHRAPVIASEGLVSETGSGPTLQCSQQALVISPYRASIIPVHVCPLPSAAGACLWCSLGPGPGPGPGPARQQQLLCQCPVQATPFPGPWDGFPLNYLRTLYLKQMGLGTNPSSATHEFVTVTMGLNFLICNVGTKRIL